MLFHDPFHLKVDIYFILYIYFLNDDEHEMNNQLNF